MFYPYEIYMIRMCRNIRTGRENYSFPGINIVLEENVMLLQEKKCRKKSNYTSLYSNIPHIENKNRNKKLKEIRK